MLPVEPNIERLFLKSAPSKDFSSVSFKESSLSTGAQGFTQLEARENRNVEGSDV